MYKSLLVALAGSASAPALASPVPNHQVRGLSPEQIKAGCTLNMAPPFRPECHTVGEGHATHAGATPDPYPDIDVGCEHDGQIIAGCHLRIGHHRPNGRPIDAGDPTLPSEDAATTIYPTSFPFNHTGNWTRHGVPSTTVSSRPSFPGLFTPSPTLTISTSGPSRTSSPTPSSSNDLGDQANHDEPSAKETSTASNATTAPSYSTTTATSSPSPQKSSSRPSPSSASHSPSSASASATHQSTSTTSPSSSHVVTSSTPSVAHTTVSSSRPKADTTSSPTITSPPTVTHSTSTTVSSGITSLPSITRSSSSSLPQPTVSSSSRTSSTVTPKQGSTMIPTPSLSNPSTAPTSSSAAPLKGIPVETPTPVPGHPKENGHPIVVVDPPELKDNENLNGTPTIVVDGPGPKNKTMIDGPPIVVIDPPGPNDEGKLDGPSTGVIDGVTPKNMTRLDGSSIVAVEDIIPKNMIKLDRPPMVDAVALKDTQNITHHLTAVINGVAPDDKDKKHLALGLGIGLGAGIPAVGVVRWMSKCLGTISTLAKNSDIYTAVMRAMTTFRMDMVPHFNFRPGGNPARPGRPGRGGNPSSEVAESVDEWYDELCRNGNTGEQAAEIINNFKADMAAAEAAMGDEAVDAESVVGAAAGRTFSNPSVLQSWACQAAAQIGSTPGADAGELADALLKAGVPGDAIQTTVDAIAHSVSTAAKGWIGRPAFNAALGVISSAVTSSGVAAAEAAKAAVNGASGPGLAWSLGPAGVPASAADATAAAMKEAIQAAKASGAEPVVAAINVISKAAAPEGLAAAAAYDGASGSSLAPHLSAAGVPPESLSTTADAVSSALSANGGSQSAALNAAADIIASAASPAYKRANSPASPVSPAQAALDVVGASFNFWNIMPWLIWDTLNKLDANGTDSSETDILTALRAMGPPPEWPSRFTAFPYQRGGNRVTGLPPLPTDAPRPTPSVARNGAHHGTYNSTHSNTQNSTQYLMPTLKPAPPGTGGYLYDGTKPTPSARG